MGAEGEDDDEELAGALELAEELDAVTDGEPAAFLDEPPHADRTRHRAPTAEKRTVRRRAEVARGVVGTPPR